MHRFPAPPAAPYARDLTLTMPPRAHHGVHPTRRDTLAALAVLATTSAATLAGCGVPAPAAPAAGAARLRLLAEATLPHRHAFDGTPVGGLSGIDHDGARGDYLLLSDDRSEFAPARYYTARWPAGAGAGGPELTHTIALRAADGSTWPSRRQPRTGVPVPDPEAIRLRPDTQTLLWTSEGDLAAGFGPALYESGRDGRLLRTFTLPAMFGAGDGRRRGPRDNQGFEGLALTPDGQQAWLAMENALAQDGPLPSLAAPGGPCRFTLIDLARGEAVRQIAYVPDAIPFAPRLPGGPADNGVSEVLMLDAHRLLVLERAWAAGRGNSLRLYLIDIRAASDTLGLDTLAPGNHRPVPKTLLADFAALGLARLDNVEGMCWGPPLDNGRRRLVVVSDDNFNPMQVTQFAAFEFTEP